MIPLMACAASGCVGLKSHCKDPVPPPPPTVLVTGLVKTPTRLPIPCGGLTLRDALGLTHGDDPMANFKKSPVYVLVEIERTKISRYYSFPLVMNDVAGKIRLREGDTVNVRMWYDTDLAFLLAKNPPEDPTLVSDGTFAMDQNAAKSYFGINLKSRPRVDYRVGTSVFGANPQLTEMIASVKNRKSAGDPKAVEEEWDEEPMSVWKLNGKAFDLSKTQTVGVLRRQKSGRQLEFVLLRANPPQVPASEADYSELMTAVLLPGDYYSVDVLERMPLIMASLNSPQLFDPCHKDEHECLPRVHSAWEDTKAVVHGLIAPAAEVVRNVGGLVLEPLDNARESALESYRR
jgi:hypothetical protein